MPAVGIILRMSRHLVKKAAGRELERGHLNSSHGWESTKMDLNSGFGINTNCPEKEAENDEWHGTASSCGSFHGWVGGAVCWGEKYKRNTKKKKILVVLWETTLNAKANTLGGPPTLQ